MRRCTATKMEMVMFGEKATLLLFLCLYITPLVSGTGAACLEGFAALDGSRKELGEGQFIIPSMNFKCDGNITHIMFVASGEDNPRLQFQAWKPLPSEGMATAYSLATSVDVSLRFTSERRTTITEVLASPLPVSASHVLGILVTDTDDVTLSVSESIGGGFTMYSTGEMRQTLRTSNLATSTSISVFVSVSFEMSPSSTSAAEMMPLSSSAAETHPSSPVQEAASSSSAAVEMVSSLSTQEIATSSSSSSSVEETLPSSPALGVVTSSSPAATDFSQSTASRFIASGSSSITPEVSSDFSASQAEPESALAGAIVGVMLGVCVVVVALVMGVICFGVFRSRRSAKSRLKHHSYTNAVFSRESDAVTLLTNSTMAEPLFYEHSAPILPPGEVAVLLPSYETIARHHDSLGNEWFANAHTKDGVVHLYEAVDNQDHPAQPFPVYSYVPTMDARRGGGTATALTVTQQDHIYADMEAIYEGVASAEEEENYYSVPPNSVGQLYDYLAEKKCIEIPSNAVRREETLGSGEFGEVFKGVLDTPYGPQEVAAKMLKAESGDKEKAKFLQEAATMAQFRHPHIVRLLGAVTVDDPCVLVLELLPRGDLRKYLTSQRPEPGHLPEDTLPAKLLTFCQEIADGMRYLSNKGFIHRDLAARNILLDKNLRCKIADFGMSKNMESDYYMSTGGKVPIRWTAPECLFYKKFCAGSDVWSYGMLLFEIWSLGRPPFPDLAPMQVVKKLQESRTYVQPPPPGCPRDIYKLMVYCWSHDHHKRPSVHSVTEVLSGPTATLLSVPQEEVQDTRAAQLGAPMECGKQLYIDLQQYYNTN